MCNPTVKVIDIDIVKYNKLFAKLMQSIAIKCDCTVYYDQETNRIIYKGPERNIDYVINETAKILDIPPHKFKKKLIK